MNERARFERLVHRVNNLLGTIEIQSEVARGVGTPDAMAAALDHIVESARRTRDELRDLAAARDSGEQGA